MYVDHRQIPSKSYFLALSINFAIGCLSGGFVLAGAGISQVLDLQQTDWDPDNVNRNNTILSSIAVLGLMMGSVFSKPILAWGRRRSILLSNAIIFVMTIPYFFAYNLYVLASTRFVIGVCSAFIINATSCYIGEAVPSEYQTTIGTTINTGLVSGIFITSGFNLALPYWTAEEDPPAGAEDSYLWRISFSLQLGSVAISSIFWLFFFRNEPLKFLISKAERDGMNSSAHEEASRVLRENYELMAGEQSEMDAYADVSRAIQQEAGSQEKPGYYRALTDPMYRNASIICIIIAIMTQATGINAINIYSTQIYTNIQEQSTSGGGISPPFGSFLNALAQLIACLFSPFVSYFSFRTIINGGLLVLSIAMGVIAILAYYEQNTILVFVMMIFLATFQATLGTYTWVYLGQVACDEGLSMATFVLWAGCLVLSIWTNKMFDVMTSTGVFGFFASCCLVSFIFFFFTLKETKGIPRDQAQVLYSSGPKAQQSALMERNQGKGKNYNYSMAPITEDSDAI